MTPAEILAAVQADQDLIALKPDTEAIAVALSAGRMKFTPTEIGNGTILEVLGLAKGNALIDLINTHSDFRHVKPLAEQGRLRLDTVLVRATLQSLVPTVLTQGEADSLVARAKVPDPVGEFDVRCALIADDGTWKV